MKIILKYILTNVKERRMRTAVMLLSILLSTTLIFVSFSIGASYESAQRKMAQGMAGSASVSVSVPGGFIESGAIPDSLSIGAAVGVLKGAALYHENGYYETVDLIGADLDSLNAINPPRLAQGESLSGFSGMEVVLPDRFSSKFGIQKGDAVTLQVGQASVSFQVAAVAAYDTVFLRHTRGATALLPLPAMAGLIGSPEGGFSEILIRPAAGVSTSALIGELREVLPEAYRVSAVVNEARVAADARQKSMPFFLISFFSLTMSVFIIYSSYKVITLDRLPVIGTFRSIGSTQRNVTRILLLESMVYGVLGGLLGLPAGALALKLLLEGMGRTLSQGIAIPVVIIPYSVLLSFAVAVLVSLFGAWLPIHRASRLPIKDVVLGTAEEKRAPRLLTAAAGLLLFAVSALLPKSVSVGVSYPVLVLAGGFSLLGMIAAAILLIPMLANLFSAAAERLFGRLLGNEASLAVRNMRDNKNISQNITLLFISISAVIAITVVGDFVTAYVGDVFEGAELQGFADGTMDQDFVDRVSDMDGIGKVLPLYVFNNRIQINERTVSRLEATDSLEWYSSMLALNYSEKGMLKQAVSSFESGRAVLLSESFMEQAGCSAGDTLTLSDGEAQAEYVVAGSFKSRATDVEAIIPSAYAVLDFGASAYGFLAYTAADPDAVMVQIRALFGDTSNWSRTVEEFNGDALSTVGAFLQPMRGMTGFILLLAGVGVINNLLINHIQRRRATAMYKSIGMSRRQHMKMTLIEGFSSGLLGTAAAIGVSYWEIQTIFAVAGPKIRTVPKLDAGAFLTAGLMGVAVTLAGSLAPIIKSRHIKLAEEIKFD